MLPRENKRIPQFQHREIIMCPKFKIIKDLPSSHVESFKIHLLYELYLLEKVTNRAITQMKLVELHNCSCAAGTLVT